MYKKKRGFTLAEVMITMMILSLIILAILQISKPFQPKYKTIYYYAFNMVKKICGEEIAKSADKLISYDDNIFCTDIIDMVNTTPNTNCTMGSATKESPLSGMTQIRIENPNFTLTNGMRIYLSARVPGIGEDPGYRIIAVDLNGKSKPNTAGEDVVTFIVFDKGEVFPIGIAADKEEYMATQVGIYDVSDRKLIGDYLTNPESLTKSKTTFSYRKGYCEAGITSKAYPDYCSGTPAYSVDSECTTEGQTCIMSILKPLIKVRM